MTLRSRAASERRDHPVDTSIGTWPRTHQDSLRTRLQALAGPWDLADGIEARKRHTSRASTRHADGARLHPRPVICINLHTCHHTEARKRARTVARTET